MKKNANFILLACILFCMESRAQVSAVIKPLFTTDESNMELGISNQWGNVGFISITGRLPLQKNSRTNTQIDRFSNDGRLILKGNWEYDMTTAVPGSPAKALFTGLSAEAGVRQFEYFPAGGNAIDQTRFSYGADLLFGYYQRRTSGNALSPQLKFRYSREWKAGDEIGIVMPGAPSTVKDMIIDPPSVRPSFTAGLGIPFQARTPNIGFAGAVFLTSSSSTDAYSPFAQPVQRLKSEIWMHYYPGVGAGLTNTRLGVGLFQSERVAGTDNLLKSEFGIILQLKTGTTFVDFL